MSDTTRTVRSARVRPAGLAVAAAAAAAGVVTLALGVSSARPGTITAVRLGGMLLLIAAAVLVAVALATPTVAHRPRGARLAVARMSVALAAATFAVMVAGASGKVPPTPLRAIHEVGGGALVLGLAGLAWSAMRRERRRPAIRLLAGTVLGLALVEIASAGGPLGLRLAPVLATWHQAVSGTLWAAMVALAALAYRLPPSPAPTAASAGAAAPALAVARAYLQLTKPRIIVLLLITTVPAMILAAGSFPSVWLILATLAGGAMAAGAANAINCYLDRDIDSVMSRTRRRPLPASAVDPRAALRFGVILAFASVVWLVALTNPVAAALSTAAILFYVFVYTAWMKRSTPQNIVIGGAAGAMPALVGWAAVTGTVAPPPVLLFAVVFLWTPPHFWALSLRYIGDYRAAGIPMLPVVRGVDETTRRIVRYTASLLPVTIALAPIAHLGPVYLAAAAVSWGWLMAGALRLRRDTTLARAMHLFHTSNAYLALLFAAVAVDVLLRQGG